MQANKDKRMYPSSAQKRRLLSCLEADDELRQGKFTSKFSKKEAERRWDVIAQEANSIPGVKKIWKEWRKTWQDMKSKTKKKHSAVNRAFNLTGGGPPPPPLSEEEAIVLRTISESSLRGHHDSQESEVEFIDQMNPECKPLSPEQMLKEGNSSYITGVPFTVQQDLMDPLNMLSDEQILQEGFSSSMATTVIETPVAAGKGKRKTSALKRLQQSTDVAKALAQTLKDKNDIKKDFYEKYLIELHRQTDALLLIANNLSRP